MQKIFLIAGSISGALSVAIGAFGAHKLKPFLLQTGRLDTFEKGVQYQFYHSFALLILGLIMMKMEHKFLNYAGYCFMGGIIVFSGSLYILCLSNVSKWGAVTPFGGVLMIAGWVLMAMAFAKN
jgi:uncharacterized membrane protein YgdD (TMEM256/DUF423 family)